MIETYDAYMFAPIYNVDLDSDIALSNPEFLSIISVDTYFSKYKKMFLDEYLCELESCFSYSFVGLTLKSRPFAKHMIVRKIKLPFSNDPNNSEEVSTVIRENATIINNFLAHARLFQKGNLHIGNYFILSDYLYHSHSLPFSTFQENIYNQFNKKVSYDNYKLDINSLDAITEMANSLAPILAEENMALVHFNYYYMSSNVDDKILKLITILEMTMLNGIKAELSYRLQIRVAHLLKRDVSNILKKAYDLRSEILHNGDVPAKFFKNKDERYDDLFIFIKDELEPIVREVLLKYLKGLVDTKKTPRDFTDDMDKEIFEKLSSD